jgi:hypothetical protein
MIRRQGQENLKTNIQDKLPQEYQRCLTGMNQVLRLSWKIVDTDRIMKIQIFYSAAVCLI